MSNVKMMNFAFQWHITSYCTNRCKHCYMYDEKHTLLEVPSEKELFYIYSKIEEFEKKYKVNMKNFVLTGGDPMSSPHFWKLVNKLHCDGRNISILGIPEQVNEENIKLMKKYKIKYFQVSIDGDEEIHDNIRGKGSYQRTMDAIVKLGKHSIPVGVMYTLHDMNKDSMFKVIAALEHLKVKVSFAFDFLVTEGNATKYSECRMIASEQVDDIFEKYIDMADELGKRNSRVRLVMKNKLLALKNGIRDLDDKEKMIKKYPYVCGCYNGFSSVAILPNGEVQPCRRLNMTIGNLYESSFEEIFLENSFLRKMRRREFFELCIDCKYYTVCKGCLAIAKSFSGNPFGANPYCTYKKHVDEKNLLYSCPSIDCSNEEEMSLIKEAYKNKMLQLSDVEIVRTLLNEKKEKC